MLVDMEGGGSIVFLFFVMCFGLDFGDFDLME